MFSPSVRQGNQNGSTGSAPNTRGRRRQRPQSNDSITQQPEAKRTKRQRLPLNETTFVNPEAPPETFEVKSGRPSTTELKQDGPENPPQPKKELSFRSKKAKTGERLNKGDGSIVLTNNNGFIVSKLPALPDCLRADLTSETRAVPYMQPLELKLTDDQVGRQHGIVDPSTGYALCLTHTHAIVWPYSLPTPSPESFTFALPYPSKHSTDPLPLGSLVSPSASSSEPGLVVVVPTSGRITYWESISSATTLDFMSKQRNGVEDSVPGMYSGETVLQIVNAESAAGYILAFSSGRMAYMSVRDAHGRPAVSVHFLRSSLGPLTGGIFGSFRHYVSPAVTQSDIAAVRSDRSSKPGERTVVTATAKGRLHAWRIHRGGHHDVLTEYDAREALVKAIIEQDEENSGCSADTFRVLDFAFVPKVFEAKYTEMSQLRQDPGDDKTQHLLLLVSSTRRNTSRYALVEVLLPEGASAENSIHIGAVRPISSYSAPPDTHALAKPRLYLPRPAVVAFLVFERATVVVSIAKPPDSPDSQLMEDSHILPATYEDVVDLKEDPTLEIVGSGMEEPQIPGSDEIRIHQRIKSKNPSAVLLVRGAGTLRVTTTDVERFASEKPPVITPKSKLEQAVFFGIKEGNPLVFDIARDLPFTSQEIGDAALDLSCDILASNNPHLTALAPLLENNMQMRVRALDKLMAHLKTMKVDLSRKTRWELLWNAEKLHAAKSMWQKHQEFLNSRTDNSRKDLVAETVEYIRKEEKHKPDASKGEVDQLRHWFVHDTFNMHIFLAWAYEVIKYNFKAKLDRVTLTRMVYEAMEINNSAIQDAMAYRISHLSLYGLQGEKMANGILADDYHDLPCPWTSEHYITNNLKRLVELATQWSHEHFSPDASDEPDQVIIRRIHTLLPQVTEVYLTALQEHTRWGLATEDPKIVTLAHTFQKTYDEDRYEKVVLLAQSHNWDSAIKLAEEHRSLNALAKVLISEITFYREKIEEGGLSPEENERVEELMARKEKQVRDYFAKYGEDFAFPFYDHLMDVSGIDAVLEYSGDRDYKTAFLRTKPQLAKVSWINDIIGEGDMVHAADTLLDIGLVREQQLWNKKIELSLGKLARMAEASRPASKASFSVQEANVKDVFADASLDAIDKELSIIKIQDQLYGQIRPVVSAALDESAELPLAIDEFALKIPKKYKVLCDLYEEGLSRLLKHEALEPLTLIDLLTLVPLKEELKELMINPFFLAIEVANYGLAGEARSQAERLVWRRLYLREDWTKINNTSLKGDSDVMESLGGTELFSVFCILYAHEQKAAKGKPYRRITPGEALGVYTENLDQRFENVEQNYRERFLDLMRWEDASLKKHIDKHRLEQWAKDARKMAEDCIDREFDQKTAEGASSQSPFHLSKATNEVETNGTH